MTANSNGCYYLIGDCVEFRPEENLLYSRITGEKITIFVAASRCLQLLLSQQGKLVAQQELFDAGWQKNAMGVSNNTFYQNILMLRKGLKLAGCGQVVIKTVPRQGLTIPSTVPVEEIMPGNDTEHHEKTAISAEDKPLTASDVKERKKPLLRYLWVVLLCLCFCTAIVMLVMLNSTTKKNFFSDFNYIGKIERCSVYLDNSRTSLKSYMQFIKQTNFTCKKQLVVYFITYPLVPRASAISCDRPFSSGAKNSCISEYHLEWQHHE